jgi:hypothetical protein
MKKIFTLLSIVALTLVSCKTEIKPEDTTDVVVVDTVNVDTVKVDTVKVVEEVKK